MTHISMSLLFVRGLGQSVGNSPITDLIVCVSYENVDNAARVNSDAISAAALLPSRSTSNSFGCVECEAMIQMGTQCVERKQSAVLGTNKEREVCI
jgi:hypothetical protein